MSKQLFTHELAEMVASLLICPNALGELDSNDAHGAFVRDIAEVVSQHCGGSIIDVVINDDEDPSPGQKWLVGVAPNDSLPSLHQNVWAYYDADGWDEGLTGGLEDLDLGEALSEREIRMARELVLSNLIGSASQTSTRFAFDAVDWQLIESGEVDEPGDEQVYSVNMTLGNQSHIDILDASGESRLALTIEIDRGVPAIHLAKDDDHLVHIHAAHDGLVVTPGSDLNRLDEPAPCDRYSYFDSNSLLIRHS